MSGRARALVVAAVASLLLAGCGGGGSSSGGSGSGGGGGGGGGSGALYAVPAAEALSAAMIAAFAEQFPNAGETPADLEPVNFGDGAGQDFPDTDDDD